MVNACLAPFKDSGRQIDVCVINGGRYIVDADLAGGQRFGSSWARTAYFCEPWTFTWATPLIVESVAQSMV